MVHSRPIAFVDSAVTSAFFTFYAFESDQDIENLNILHSCIEHTGCFYATSRRPALTFIIIQLMRKPNKHNSIVEKTKQM